MDYYSFSVDAQGLGLRIDSYLTDELDASRNAIQKLIDETNVKVNGNKISKSYKLKHNDLIEVFIPPPREITIEPEEIDLDILYEDDEVIVINKPQGLVVHIGAGHFSGTLVNALLFHCKGTLSGINGVKRPGIVHRIDKDTSGVLVATKTDAAHLSLAEQFAKHSITRVYNALACGNIKDDCGTINAPIGRSAVDRKKMTVTVKNGKNAVTHYEVLQRFNKYTHIKARLETGRTHQIRVHLAHISHPLVGDHVYGKRADHLVGQALHASVLGFVHPTKNVYMEFFAQLPDYFQKLIGG